MSHLGFADPWGECSQKVFSLFKRGPLGLPEYDLGGNFTVVHISKRGGAQVLSQAVDVVARGECGSAQTAPDPLLDWVYEGLRDQGTFEKLPQEPSKDRQAFFWWLSDYTS